MSNETVINTGDFTLFLALKRARLFGAIAITQDLGKLRAIWRAKCLGRKVLITDHEVRIDGTVFVSRGK